MHKLAAYRHIASVLASISVSAVLISVAAAAVA
jgi:hypothetical protein